MRRHELLRAQPNSQPCSSGKLDTCTPSAVASCHFWEMVKFVDLGVLYFSLVLPGQATWLAVGPEWNLRSLGGLFHRLKRRHFHLSVDFALIV